MSTLYWPSWRYRRGENGEIEKRVFQNQAELDRAGSGWVQSPADVDTAKPEEAEALDFAGLSDADLREIAAKGGIKIDGRWKRARIEAALRGQ